MVGLLMPTLTCWGSGRCCPHGGGHSSRDGHDGRSFHDLVNQMVNTLGKERKKNVP